MISWRTWNGCANQTNHTVSRVGPSSLHSRDTRRRIGTDDIAGEVLKAINNLVVLLSDQFLVHNSVHRPLRRLLRSCIGDTGLDGDDDDKVHGRARRIGAAAADSEIAGRIDEELEGDLVDLMCTLCSRMRA